MMNNRPAHAKASLAIRECPSGKGFMPIANSVFMLLGVKGYSISDIPLYWLAFFHLHHILNHLIFYRQDFDIGLL